MFLVRPGGQSQCSHMLSPQTATSQPLRELQVWMIENLCENLSVERLAKRMGMSSCNFTRVCLSETRMNPGQFVDRMRVEAAQQMIDSAAMGLKEIADACGFQTPLACAERFYVFSALLPANMQATLGGRKARPKCLDEANAGYLITSCMLVARGAARAIST